MAVKTGGTRRGSTYKVVTDSALTNTMIVDVTGSAGTFYGCECVAGSGTIVHLLSLERLCHCSHS